MRSSQSLSRVMTINVGSNPVIPIVVTSRTSNEIQSKNKLGIS